jgi:carbamoyltransferase
MRVTDVLAPVAAGAPPPARGPAATCVLAVSTGRHAAAAVLQNGRPVAAIEEAKLARSRQPGGCPARAIRYCLIEAGVGFDDLSAVALSSRPAYAWMREQRLRARWRMMPLRSGLGAADRLARELAVAAGDAGREGLRGRFHRYEHHLCHAASAYYPSPFDRALVLTLDGGGDGWSGLAAMGEGTALDVLSAATSPHALGWLYSRITELLGYVPRRDEHKTQWLGTQGAPDYLPVFRQLLDRPSRHEWPVLGRRHVAVEGGRWTLAPHVRHALGVTDPESLPDRDHAAAIACSLQAFLEETVVDLAERLRRRTAADHVCLAGGVFLNTLLVRALEERTGYRGTFVYPAAGNAGAAIGAGYLAARAAAPDAPRDAQPHLHLGPRFDAGQIKQVLDNCKLVYRYHEREEQLLADVVSILGRGRCLAWYQDRVEFGLRALGNRSILASPFSPYVAENLNHYIKHRDGFHPFILSVPAERAAELFDCTANCASAASVGTLRVSSPDLERFAVGGGRVRLHTVERDVNPRFWRLLHAFGAGAPAPILVNTSFNLFGEPLVCDPRDAVRSFYCAGIDALAIGHFVVAK